MADSFDPDERLVLTAPAVTFAVRLALASAALVSVTAWVGTTPPARLAKGLMVIAVIAGVIIWWGYRHGLRTVVGLRGIQVTRKCGPVVSVTEVEAADIRKLRMPPYSRKLLAELRSGGEVVIANKHSVPDRALPDLPPSATVPLGGPIRTLLQVKAAIEQEYQLDSENKEHGS